MKKSFFCLLTLMVSIATFAQADSLQPPYKRFPGYPPFQLLLGDSTTKYTKAQLPKKKPVLFMIFSPQCSHCQHTAEEMLQYKDELKDIHIVMTTMHSVTEMNEFVQHYKLNELDNLVVGKDVYYIMPSFYNIKSLPYLAFYNKKGDLIMGFEGSMPLKRVIEVFNQRK